ncbi:hypothetical protein FH972_014555 [Carpinus fangiana]|uniref:Uncharacterized protein n=1 Tax=Carpinus fangiana TaxID=176857 RepID=A0A5N6RAC6_9ROSI|nr:hypothetical protein FH972_014555 [Carpinus fangiana]
MVHPYTQVLHVPILCLLEYFKLKSIDIVNVELVFCGHYDAFSPYSLFSALSCEVKAQQWLRMRKGRRGSRICAPRVSRLGG